MLLSWVRQAFTNTLKLFGFNIRTWLVAALLFLFGYFSKVMFSGQPVKMDWGVYLVLIFIGVVFVKNLIMAPLEIERSKIRSGWEGSRYVLSRLVEKHILIKVEQVEPTICTLPCPPSSLAHIKYEFPQHQGNVLLAIRQVGASDVPSLSRPGTAEVVVNQDSQIELLTTPLAGSNTGNVSITFGLLGWTES